MEQNGMALFDLAERRLAWIDRRQGLLAQNIANANTPGYMAKDLVPFAQTLAKGRRAGAQPVRASDPPSVRRTGIRSPWKSS